MTRWDADALRVLMEEHIPFNKHLGIRALTLTPECVELCLPFQEHLIGDPLRRALHGGTISTLIDTAGGAIAFLHIGEGERVSTVDLVVDYLRPGPAADIVARATIGRRGNRVILANVLVTPRDQPDVLLAQGRGVYNVARTPSGS